MMIHGFPLSMEIYGLHTWIIHWYPSTSIERSCRSVLKKWPRSREIKTTAEHEEGGGGHFISILWPLPELAEPSYLGYNFTCVHGEGKDLEQDLNTY